MFSGGRLFLFLLPFNQLKCDYAEDAKFPHTYVFWRVVWIVDVNFDSYRVYPYIVISSCKETINLIEIHNYWKQLFCVFVSFIFYVVRTNL